MTYISNSREDTVEIGRAVCKAYPDASVFALYGDLGAGKTAFTHGVAQELQCIDPVSSPTYAIVNEYRGSRQVAHFDMYRILDEDSLYDIGWEDYLASGALCVVEWSQNVEGAMPNKTVKITIDKTQENGRRITVEPYKSI